MADGPISSRNALTATGVTDPPDIRIGIDNLQGATPASNQMSLPELGKAIGSVINKDTVAEMLALTGVPDGTRVDTARYSTSHTVGDGSDGEYVYDADSTATIDGGFVMPGVGGSLSFSGTTFNGTAGTGRWLAKSIEYPEQFGASKDIADNSSAVQRAFGSGNRKLTFKSLLPVTSAVELKSDLVLHGPGGLSRSGEVCTVSATVERLSATDFNFSGQISITAGLFKSKFSRCYFYSNGASNRCIYVTNEAIYDTSFEGSCNFVSTASQSVPLFEVDFDGQALNQVYVKDSRFDCTGNPAVITAPCVKITHQGTSANYNTNLVFENLNFEKPAAGAIHATGCLNVVCRNIGIWDMQLTGAQIDDMLQFSQTGSRRCENIMIDGYFRRQNAPSGSNTFFDINMPANQVRTVTLMNVGYRPIPTRIDLGATAGNTVEVYSSEHISIATVHSTVTLHGRDQKTDNLGNLTGAVTINLGAGLGDTKYGVLTGNATVTFSGSRVGWYTIRLTQDATGGRTVTFANIQNSPPTITATANAKTLLRVYHDGFGNYWCVAGAVDQIIVDTVAEMLALTGVPDGTRVDTARYSTSHTVGDGSGGEYVYDADSTATIDGGFVLPGVGGALSFSGTTFDGTAGTGRWLAKDTTVARLLQFGGLAGTDAWSAMQRATDSINAIGGGDVVLCEGTYPISAQLITRSNVRWLGAGPKATTLDFSGVFASTDYAVYAQYASRSSHFVVENLGMVADLDLFDADGSDKYLVFLRDAEKAAAKNCFFSGAEYGFCVAYASKHCTVERCEFFNCWYGGCYFFALAGNPSQKNTMVNSIAWTDHAPELFSWDGTSGVFTIASGNTKVVENARLRLRETVPANVSKDVYYYAVNATLTGFQVATSRGGSPISLGDTNASAVCLVSHVWTGGFRMEECYDSSISQCSAWNCSEGFRIENSSDNTIVNCVGYENEQVGLELYNFSSRNTVSGCMFRDNNTANNDGTDTTANAGNANRKLSGLSIEHQSDSNIIEGNRLYNTGSPGRQKYGIGINMRNFSSTATQSEGNMIGMNYYNGNEIDDISDRGFQTRVLSY